MRLSFLILLILFIFRCLADALDEKIHIEYLSVRMLHEIAGYSDYAEVSAHLTELGEKNTELSTQNTELGAYSTDFTAQHPLPSLISLSWTPFLSRCAQISGKKKCT